jgi:hypothetical protein
MAGTRFQAGVAILFATGSGLSWETIILILRNGRGAFSLSVKAIGT